MNIKPKIDGMNSLFIENNQYIHCILNNHYFIGEVHFQHYLVRFLMVLLFGTRPVIMCSCLDIESSPLNLLITWMWKNGLIQPWRLLTHFQLSWLISSIQRVINLFWIVFCFGHYSCRFNLIVWLMRIIFAIWCSPRLLNKILYAPLHIWSQIWTEFSSWKINELVRITNLS